MRRFVISSRALFLFLGAVLIGCVNSSEDNPAVPETETTAPQSVDRSVDWQARIARHLEKHRAFAAKYEAQNHDRHPFGAPVPIPGGLAEGLHLWLPGPLDLGFQGTDVEPSTITDYLGFSAIAYPAGTVTGSNGVTYDAFHDMRLYQGFYRDEGGRLAYGTFVFV